MHIHFFLDYIGRRIGVKITYIFQKNLKKKKKITKSKNNIKKSKKSRAHEQIVMVS